jgi:hypothetical protein
VEATDRFLPYLKEIGFEVEVSESLDVYTDSAAMAATDLVVQCWTMGALRKEQAAGLIGAVRAGTGLAGWHGGIVDSFHDSPAYQWLTGGQFMAHPGGQIDHEVQVVSDHPIVAGIGTISVHTEQYWVLSDELNNVLATTTVAAKDDWDRPVTVPAVWTRNWGAGKVFVSTIGHNVADLDVPEVRTITERGLAWASR